MESAAIKTYMELNRLDLKQLPIVQIETGLQYEDINLIQDAIKQVSYPGEIALPDDVIKRGTYISCQLSTYLQSKVIC